MKISAENPDSKYYLVIDKDNNVLIENVWEADDETGVYITVSYDESANMIKTEHKGNLLLKALGTMLVSEPDGTKEVRATGNSFFNENLNLSGEQKFNSCMFRSETEEPYEIKRCCYAEKSTGFICRKRAIYGININTCTDCVEYSKK